MILRFWSTVRRLQREKLALESRLEALERKLDEERDRNRERENFLISQVLTAAGRYGLPASVDPPKYQMTAQAPPKQAELTALQRSIIAAVELEGRENGRSESQIRQAVKSVKRGESMPVFEDDVIN